MLTVKVEGLGEFNKFCKKYPAEVYKSVAGDATFYAAEVFERQAKVTAPSKKRQRIARSLKTVRSPAPFNIVKAEVGVSKKVPSIQNAFFWRFLELGTKGGYAIPKVFKSKKAIEWPGQHPIREPVRHPGVRARRFLTQAFEIKKIEALHKFMAKLKSGMARIAAGYGYKVE